MPRVKTILALLIDCSSITGDNSAFADIGSVELLSSHDDSHHSYYFILPVLVVTVVHSLAHICAHVVVARFDPRNGCDSCS